MAKKNTTPQSILDAPPIPEPVYLIKHEHPNREIRRSKTWRRFHDGRRARNLGNGWLINKGTKVPAGTAVS